MGVIMDAHDIVGIICWVVLIGCIVGLAFWGL